MKKKETLRQRYNKATSLYLLDSHLSIKILLFRNHEITEEELLEFVDQISKLVRKELKKKKKGGNK